jgi:pimeloyl-ACP methyl ester carboxylesterase
LPFRDVKMNLHELTARSGYDYLTRQVAALDATDNGRIGLASYYAERGESPGVWVGSGMKAAEAAGCKTANGDPHGAAAATPSGLAGWRSIPSWYLLGTEDRAIAPAGQRFMAERGNAQIEEVTASHASMVSQPEAVTPLILRAVEETSRSQP